MRPQHNWQPKHHRDRRVFFGAALAILGVVGLLTTFYPGLVHTSIFSFSWPVVLIIVGAAIGLKTGFRRNAWWILMLIGGVHLIVPHYFPDVPTHRVLWPALLIGLGISLVLGRNDRRHWRNREQFPPLTNDADTVNIDVTFGGRKEVVTSRSFRGGVVRATFSGVEINLANADGDAQPMTLEVYATFAGVELIVPPHWEIQNEISPMMGSVEDHRSVRLSDAATERRTLALRGSCSFGSVEIKSY